MENRSKWRNYSLHNVSNNYLSLFNSFVYFYLSEHTSGLSIKSTICPPSKIPTGANNTSTKVMSSNRFFSVAVIKLIAYYTVTSNYGTYAFML